MREYSKQTAYILGADSEYYYATAAITNGSKTIAHQPDNPRNITITVTDGNSSISAGLVTITGKDIDGSTVTEVLNLANALTLTGTKIFKTITSIVVSNLTGNEGGDTLKIGSGTVVQIFYGQGTFVSATPSGSGTTIGTFGFVDGITGTIVNVGQLKEGIATKTYLYDAVIGLGLRLVIAGDSPITINYTII